MIHLRLQFESQLFMWAALRGFFWNRTDPDFGILWGTNLPKTKVRCRPDPVGSTLHLDLEAEELPRDCFFLFDGLANWRIVEETAAEMPPRKAVA